MKPPHSQHWAAQQERGNRLFLALTTLMVRYLPAWLLNPCIGLVVCYFYATAPRMRRHVRRYQTRLLAAFPQLALPRMAHFRQFTAFGVAICDRFAVWQRKIRYADLVVEDPDGVSDMVDSGGPARIWATPKSAAPWWTTIRVSSSTCWCTASTRRRLTKRWKKPAPTASK